MSRSFKPRQKFCWWENIAIDSIPNVGNRLFTLTPITTMPLIGFFTFFFNFTGEIEEKKLCCTVHWILLNRYRMRGENSLKSITFVQPIEITRSGKEIEWRQVWNTDHNRHRKKTCNRWFTIHSLLKYIIQNRLYTKETTPLHTKNSFIICIDGHRRHFQWEKSIFNSVHRISVWLHKQFIQLAHYFHYIAQLIGKIAVSLYS